MSLESASYAGTIFARPVDADGVATAGFLDIGEVYPLELQASTTQIKVKSRKVETKGQTIAAKNELDDMVLSMTLRQVNARNLAWILAGSYVALSGTSGSVDAGTPEVVTAPAAGEGVRLAHRDVSSVVVKDETDTTTYTVGTDYTLHAKLGIITPIDGGGISEDDVLHASYSYAAESGYQVNFGTDAMTRVEMYGLLENEFTGTQHYIELDKVVLASSSPVNFISEDGSEGETYEFAGTLETVSGQTSPGRVDGVPM